MSQTLVINNVTYADVPEIRIPKSSGTMARFYDTSAANVTASDVLSGKKAITDSGLITGTMSEIGKQEDVIATKEGAITIRQGYHDGHGTVCLDSNEKAKLISSNIRSGVSLFGVAGSTAVIDTSNAISPALASHVFLGRQAYVNGELITGTMTVPSVSQDSVTKILTIG